MKTRVFVLTMILLAGFTAFATPIQATGIFAASGTNVWAAPQLTFTATPFAVPITAGSFDVILGGIKTPALSGYIAAGGVTPDFTLSLNSFGGITMVGPIVTFGFNISGSLNGFGGGSYDVFAVPADQAAVKHVAYTDANGSGSFDIKLRGISNVNFPGFLSVGPSNACQNNPGCALGGTITNAVFTPSGPSVPEPGTLTLISAGLGLVFAGRFRKK
jgi:hypothetical protein